jgi:hypothetical protein
MTMIIQRQKVNGDISIHHRLRASLKVLGINKSFKEIRNTDKHLLLYDAKKAFTTRAKNLQLFYGNDTNEERAAVTWAWNRTKELLNRPPKFRTFKPGLRKTGMRNYKRMLQALTKLDLVLARQRVALS